MQQLCQFIFKKHFATLFVAIYFRKSFCHSLCVNFEFLKIVDTVLKTFIKLITSKLIFTDSTKNLLFYIPKSAKKFVFLRIY